MAIITISRQEGSLSREIAATIAEKFNFEYLDKTLIENELESDFGLKSGEFSKYDEKKPSIWDKFSHEYERYFDFFKLYFLEKAAESSGCVLLGRGGAFFLKKIPGVFKIRLIASEDIRTGRICRMYDCDEKAARRIMNKTDHDRSRFHKFMFNDSWDNPYYYDMILNTDSLATDTISGVISDSVNRFLDEKYDEGSKSALTDLLTAQKIKHRILYVDNISVRLLDVRVSGGEVNMSGSLDDEASVKKCEEAAASVQGVKSVNSGFIYSPKVQRQEYI